MQAVGKTSAQDPISVLLLGDGPLVEALEAALVAAGHDVEIGEAAHAAAMFTAVAPDLVVLCGRASEHGGAPVLAALSEGAKESELKVAVLGAASSSPRATALAPNLPPAELARRLVEVARAPVPSRTAKVAAKPITAPKPAAIAAPKPAAPAPPAPAPAAKAPPVAATSRKRERTLVGMPAAEATLGPAAATPAPAHAPTDALAKTLLGIASPAALPTAAAPPPPKPAPRPAPPPEPLLATPAEPELEEATEVLVVEQPVAVAVAVAVAAPGAMGRFPTVAAAGMLAVGALCVLLLPMLGSHAKGARKLSAIEITGAIAPKTVAPSAPSAVAAPAVTVAPAPALQPAPAPEPAPAVTPEVADDDALVAPTERPAPALVPTRTTPAAESTDGTRALPRKASLGQAKAAVRKAEGYARDGRLDVAEAAYREALSLFPRYPLAIAGLARIHLERHDAGEALRWAKMLIAVQPNRGNNQRMLGDAFALAGRQADAVRAWEQAVRYGDRTARKRLSK